MPGGAPASVAAGTKITSAKVDDMIIGTEAGAPPIVLAIIM